jgi:hypothetical protein
MNFSLENGLLTTDLDCQFNNLINLGGFDPVPPGLVSDDDPRLSDERIPLDGSVTDAKVAAAAGIVQSKLSLNGVIPPAWLGTTSTKAARGDLAEYKSNKAVANGYASLDGTGKIPLGQLPALAGTGTVTSFSAGDCLPLFTTTEATVNTTPALSFALASAPANSWFGNSTGSAAPPAFRTGKFPAGLIPDLDAAIIVSGIFPYTRIPTAVYGPGNHSGGIPNPGAAVAGTETDTLCRDLAFRPTPTSAKVSVITTVGAGTFTPDTGCRALFVELWGGGGGGGGAVAPSGCAAASGGGGGAHASKWITGTIAGLYNVFVGSGGVGGGIGGGDGNPGVATTWAGGPFLANGGLGGKGDSAGGGTVGVVHVGSSGGGPASSDLGMSGGDGGDSIRWDATHGRSGDGGEGASGGGGAKGRSGDGPGGPGNTYGGGGSGALSTSVTGQNGGAGAQGVIRITQFF